MRGDTYQYALIALGTASALLFGIFFYRELFPEYKVYQNDYIALEEFRSHYTGEPPANFDIGIKQIVIERADKGPPTVDRCISCHVALKLEHFSPTRIEHDVNGNAVFDERGWPKKIKNPGYIWSHLDDKIAELEKAGDKESLVQAARYKALKTTEIDGKVYDVTKVLAMHPLMAREVRPFQYHSIDEYGCTSCHNGNGNGLTTEKAHGPLFDGLYEAAATGFEPKFTETDEENDPKFSKIFNRKPGDHLLFQTTPLFVGGLIEAKCVQCHQPTSQALQSLNNQQNRFSERKASEVSALAEGVTDEENAFIALSRLQHTLQTNGYQITLNALQKNLQDPVLSDRESALLTAHIRFLEEFAKKHAIEKERVNAALDAINQKLTALIGSVNLLRQAQASFIDQKEATEQLKAFDSYVQDQIKKGVTQGSIFEKAIAANYEKELLLHIRENRHGMTAGVGSEATLSRLFTDIDLLTPTYRKGKELYLSQACYACHRIAGFARGGVGPELTEEGNSYPWFVKESIVWPQADLPTSTMPNYRLDHDELEALMTFLMAQKGQNQTVSKVERAISIKEWDSGHKLPFEKPVEAAKIQDLRYSTTLFATEGCAACHRLKGFESDVGFRIEKEEKTSFKELYAEQRWFQQLIPESIVGSELVGILEQKGSEIDRRIVSGVRQGSILEEIERTHPGQIEALYTSFKYAARARNGYFKKRREQAKGDQEKAEVAAEEQAWKIRVHNALMAYIQEYGLGRLVGPRLNWSGVYRSDEWLMEHFKNPAGLSARSIMPVFPFDTTKFYALTYMLDILGQKNRDAVQTIWTLNGFNPALAYEIHCSQCHGNYMQGNGPIAQWIYPIPKNLRNAEFLRNLTRQRVTESVFHGVKGTPMPPWGEAASDKQMADNKPVLTEEQIEQLTDWMFSSLPGGTIIRESEDIPKWQYSPQDVLRELKEEGDELKIPARSPFHPSPMSQLDEIFPKGEKYLAAIHSTLFFPPPRKTSNVLLKEDQVFDLIPQTSPLAIDKNYYYIKKEFYTPVNLEQGRLFFEENCAACHGRDADGAGIRAGAMQDAKPRMLINFPWMETRDDLRLLRSIKYGVTGTSMQPWGDYTTSLQRMQLVMYLRSLSQEQKLRTLLNEGLFQNFNRADLIVEKARVESSKSLDLFEKKQAELHEKRVLIELGAMSPSDRQQALKLYEEELKIDQEMRFSQTKDQKFLQLRQNIAKEREFFQLLGTSFINQKASDELMQSYLNVIDALSLSYSLKAGLLEIKGKEPTQLQAAQKKLLDLLDAEINHLNKKLTNVKDSPAEFSALQLEIKSQSAFKHRLLSDIAQAKRLHKQQMELMQELSPLIKAPG